MPLLTEARVRERAQRETRTVRKSAMTRLDEAVTILPSDHFDVFLSHSSKDAELVDGARLELEDRGWSVYVDWIVDKNMPHSDVTTENANVLRKRMNQCDTLLYLHTLNAANSKWVPWELGYFDGLKGRVAILPITPDERNSFDGQEYLGLYPYVDFIYTAGNNLGTMFANSAADPFAFAPFASWVAGREQIRKRI